MKTTLVAAKPPTLARDPSSVASRVLAFLGKHPDHSYRPMDIAGEIGLSTTHVANALRVLTLRGDVTRYRNSAVINGPGASVYMFNQASVRS